jgi:hypothetical protein
MQSYRERLGIKQDFDNWAKGINNQLNNLRKQGFDNVAQYNIDVLKADGWEIRKDKNGNDVLSRAGANKEKYKEETFETAKAKRESLVGVKEAKTMQPEELEQKTPTDKNNKQPDSINDWNTTERIDKREDQFSVAADWYELSQILASEISKITGGPYNIEGAKKILHNTIGGRGDLTPYQDLARDYINNLSAMYDPDLDDYYSDE